MHLTQKVHQLQTHIILRELLPQQIQLLQSNPQLHPPLLPQDKQMMTKRQLEHHVVKPFWYEKQVALFLIPKHSDVELTFKYVLYVEHVKHWTSVPPGTIVPRLHIHGCKRKNFRRSLLAIVAFCIAAFPDLA